MTTIALTGSEQPEFRASLSRRAFQGAKLSAALLVLFLAFGGRWNEGVPNIPARIALLGILMLSGGASGGVAFFATDSLRRRGGWRKTVANVLSTTAYCVAMLVALVLGMNGPD